MPVTFSAIVKTVSVKSLVSGDKSMRVTFESEDPRLAELVTAPSDRQVSVTVETDAS